MRAFLFGFFAAMVLCAAGYHYYLRPVEPDPCRACSTGTRCAAGLCVAANAQTPLIIRKRSNPGPRARSPQPAGNAASTEPAADSSTAASESNSAALTIEAPPPPPLRPDEKKLVTVGDKLTGTEIVNLAESGAGSERELRQEDIDAVFRPRQAAIVSCIDEARGNAQLEAIITVAFRIRRSGEVAGVRIEAPAYLINHGLADCVRRTVQPLRFPASAQAQVATYPFSLR